MDSGGVINATGVSITTHGDPDTSLGNNAVGAYNGSYGTTFPGGGTLTISNSTITTTGTPADGVDTNSGGTTQLTNVTINTSGDDSLGVTSSGSGTTTTISGGSVSTAGNAAYAVSAYNGGLVSLNGTTISTTGNGSGGFGINGAGSELDATNVTITTTGADDSVSGQHSYGLYNGPYGTLPSGGVAKLTDVSISTQGVDMHGVLTDTGGVTTILGGSIATAGNGAHAILAENGGAVTVGVSASGPTTISTTGRGAAAVVAYDGGVVQLTGATVTTSSVGSSGLVVHGATSSLTASGVGVTTTGGIDPASGDHAVGADNAPYLPGGLISGGAMSLTNTAIATSGAGAHGVVTEAGGSSTVSGGSIATSGLDANAFVVITGATAQITGTTLTSSANGATGIAVTDLGSTLTALGITVTTKGGLDPATGFAANAVYAGPNPTSTSSTSGGTVSISSSTLATTGNDAFVGVADTGSIITLAGTKLSASGALGSGGLAVQGGGQVNAADVTITTAGGFDSATNTGSYGVFNGPFQTYAAGGTATLTNSSVTTSGAQTAGVFTEVGGTTTLTGTTVATSGLGASGVVTQNGGLTNVSGGSVSTVGQDAHALLVTGAGSRANVSGTTSFATTGAGAIGLYATLGGAISATGSATISTVGGVSPATGLGAYGVNADGAGSQINLGAASITTSGAGAFGLLASDRAASGSAGSITATGTLTINTTSAAAAAVGLQGNGASIVASGGGTIVSAGNAIEFREGSNQTATFDNFTINNQTGDLVFADPSTSTVNFNNTTANAGNSNLLDAAASSVATLNANASTLTGAIRTDPSSTSTVNLTKNSTWTMTGSSVVTNLSVNSSVIVFAPPTVGGGFKTLTVTNYVGAGANIRIYAALGGSNSASDQIVINRGSATGTTLLTVTNVGGAGGQTTGLGIPIVVTTNGGTVAPNAFALANTPVVGGYKYTLDQTNGNWYLVSSSVSPTPPSPPLTPSFFSSTATAASITNSVTNVAKAQQSQIITNRVLNSILLGATQQISSCSCAGGFASIGSFATGAQGRWTLSDELTLIGGFSYNQWNAQGVTVQNAPTVAGSLIYDFWKWGESRPFLEAGGALTPYEDVSYTRSYANGYTWAIGNAKTIDRDLSLFARAGWIERLTPVDEAAVYGDLGRSWMQTGGYTEVSSALNPFPATVPTGLDTLNVARLGGQYTHLLNGNIEANVSAAVAYGFGAGAGQAVSVYGFGPIAPNALPNTTWVEYGARLGYRYHDRLVIDAFVVGTAFGQVGTTIHGGVGLRYAF